MPKILHIPIHTLHSFSPHNILPFPILLHHFATPHVRISSMKRQIQNGNIESLDLAISLMLLSQAPPQHKFLNNIPSVRQEFACKTCNRKFSSFQALGGHRASHKKPKLDSQADLRKPNWEHQCSICGQRFSLGQALGGHMRKHRAALNEDSASITEVVSEVPVLKRSNSKRVMCLDLNLTPLENDLKLLFGNKAPSVDLTLC
ncbi:zinc finger protein ZAT11-like [Prosopis cineraria]|uniref:zinc finger protein ZAT11-like n=1 Tax=Prosopis cineraria TaxID=364024 RepID=UPI00241026EE|nr:zinc finger protein ZAT11-like [Prosopis cineraria]